MEVLPENHGVRKNKAFDNNCCISDGQIFRMSTISFIISFSYENYDFDRLGHFLQKLLFIYLWLFEDASLLDLEDEYQIIKILRLHLALDIDHDLDLGVSAKLLALQYISCQILRVQRKF